jgi:hypothetical protein
MNKSPLCYDCFDEGKIREEIAVFEQEASSMLLFLNNLSKIIIAEWKTGNESFTVLYQCGRTRCIL